jgi:transposase
MTLNYQLDSEMGHYEDHSWVCTKRLEKGRFHWPSANETGKVTMRPEEFSMLINGLDLKQAAPRRNWLRRGTAA